MSQELRDLSARLEEERSHHDMTRAHLGFAQTNTLDSMVAHLETRRVLANTQAALDLATTNLRETNEELERFRQRYLDGRQRLMDALDEATQQNREIMQHLDTIQVLQARLQATETRLQATEAELQLTREARDDAQAGALLNWL